MGKGNSINIRGMGSIEKLDRYRWRVRVSLGKDPVTGKYLRSPSITVHGTKTDAINALQEYRWQLSCGEAPARKGIIPTVGEYAQQFHDQREGTLGSPLTYKREGQTICRIKQYFGDYDLVDLTPAVLRATYAQLRKRGATPSGLHKLHQKLSQVMKQAVNDELIVRNPCDAISMPRPKPKERKSLEADEAARLYEVLTDGEPTAQKTAVLLAFCTGMRRGEVLGLMWKNVDLENNRLYVACQYAADGDLRDPKSENSKRWLSFGDDLKEYLLAWKEIQKGIYAELEAIYGSSRKRGRKSKADLEAMKKRRVRGHDIKMIKQGPDSPVISNEVGGFMDPNIFSRWFRGFCVENAFGHYGYVEEFKDSAGRKRERKKKYMGLNFHELRHTQATLLIGNGTDIKTVQHRLGHSTASLTMNIYAHAIAQNDRGAAEAISGILHKKTSDGKNEEAEDLEEFAHD